ncbi:NADPH:quinone oxidoreductase family protein [Sphingomonas montanisoli]|uniref:NADPH:quinone oxidoreductase family protein n=2 Tax=Sphingomonas montanisoli TaxID=2606412 RepID=A0A5D9C1Q5_9SPHN|nr:NADPH:quinone oxidoreductase family protein [Sphingomonas montanisoli]TZG24990.1 NADPH:quinone oxidoreductase family protein [Sphingomonas montanisoli]
MRRLTSHAAGGPKTLVLDDAPDPVAGTGQVLVRIAACSVNYPDSLIIEDKYQYKPERPFAPGCEIAGVIEAVGAGVATGGTGHKVGDRVMAMSGWGGMADRIAIPAAAAWAIPDAMPFEHGAAFIMTYGTAYHALVQRAAAKPGETLLVMGAAGGVGLAAVEIGAALGLKVVAGVSSDAKLAIARGYGAVDGFVYPRGPLDKDGKRALAARVKALCPDGIDMVIDPVGGDLTEAAIRGLNWGGRLLIVGFPAGIAAIPANLLLLKGAAAIGVFYGHFTEIEPQVDASNMKALLDLYSAGKLRPPISARYPLEHGAAAIAALSDPAAHGKIIVEVA